MEHLIIIGLNIAFFALVISKAKPLSDDYKYLRDCAFFSSFSELAYLKNVWQGDRLTNKHTTIRTGLSLVGIGYCISEVEGKPTAIRIPKSKVEYKNLYER